MTFPLGSGLIASVARKPAAPYGAKVKPGLAASTSLILVADAGAWTIP
jgi:hypothetical protein